MWSLLSKQFIHYTYTILQIYNVYGRPGTDVIRHVYSVVTACWSTGQSLFFKTIQSTFPHRRVWSVLARVSTDSPCEFFEVCLPSAGQSLSFFLLSFLLLLDRHSFWFSSFIFSTVTVSARAPVSSGASTPHSATRVTQSDPASTPHWCSPGRGSEGRGSEGRGSERPRLSGGLRLRLVPLSSFHGVLARILPFAIIVYTSCIDSVQEMHGLDASLPLLAYTLCTSLNRGG